ncbi:MAG: AI-2E family transporter [Acidimicrobiales bacterium]|nr:AI-2E family transporter [Acidimicrobiales bacterium]
MDDAGTDDAPTEPQPADVTVDEVSAEFPSDPNRPPAVRDTMPAWVPRAIFLFLGGVTGLYVLRWLVGELQGFLLILLVSLFLSFAFEPAVDRLSRRGMRRGLATGLVMAMAAVALVAFLGLLGQALFTQVSEFAADLPKRLERIETTVNERFDTNLDFDEFIDSYRERDLSGSASKLAENALDLGVTAVGVLFQLFTIALFTFYMVADGPRLRRTVLSFLPPARQARVVEGWELAIEKTGGYIYSRGLLAALSAVATTIVLWALGVPYWFALGIWTGLISQFIPTIGTYLAGAVPVLIALLEDPMDALIVLVFMVVYQQIENYVFAPKITARTMDLHPAVAFGTVLVGSALFGGIGALLALPAAAVIQAIGSTYFARHEVIDADLTRQVTVPTRPRQVRSRRSTGR